MGSITVLVVCAVVGVIIMSAVMGNKARNAFKEETKSKAKSSYVEKQNDVSEQFYSVYIQAAKDMAVNIQSSSDDVCHISYFDSDEVTHQIFVQDGSLVMTCTDERTFGSDIGFGDDPYIVVELPSKRYREISLISDSGQISISQSVRCSSLDVTENSGRLFVSNVDADEMNVTTESGSVSMATVVAKNLIFEGKSGDLSVINVDADTVSFSVGDGRFEGYNIVASGKASYTSVRGDMLIDGCDGALMEFDSQKGDVQLSLFKPKKIEAVSQNGKTELPEQTVTSTGSCVVNTDSGDITIKYVEG